MPQQHKGSNSTSIYVMVTNVIQIKEHDSDKLHE